MQKQQILIYKPARLLWSARILYHTVLQPLCLFRIHFANTTIVVNIIFESYTLTMRSMFSLMRPNDCDVNSPFLFLHEMPTTIWIVFPDNLTSFNLPILFNTYLHEKHNKNSLKLYWAHIQRMVNATTAIANIIIQ